MTRRAAHWLAIAAILQQVLVTSFPAAASVVGSGQIEICTPAGLIRIAADGPPAKTDRPIPTNHDGKCIACCMGQSQSMLVGTRTVSAPAGSDAMHAPDFTRHWALPAALTPRPRGPPGRWPQSPLMSAVSRIRVS